jgi:glycine cleavage system H protein
MSTTPDYLHYTKDHEWLQLEGNYALVGITDHAQQSLGDITFVELPAPGTHFSAADTFGVVESVKAASDLYMPAAGEVVAINEALDAHPERVNDDPYGEGWLVKIKLKDARLPESLLSADDYARII